MSHKYIIHGDPVAWMRPGKSGRRTYDTQKALKLHWAISIEGQKEEQPFYVKTPLIFSAMFYFRVPQSLKPSSREKLYGRPFYSKPDSDNLIKLVWDICNELLFDDDSRIVLIENVGKFYDKEPRTEFSFRPFIAKK